MTENENEKLAPIRHEAATTLSAQMPAIHNKKPQVPSPSMPVSLLPFFNPLFFKNQSPAAPPARKPLTPNKKSSEVISFIEFSEKPRPSWRYIGIQAIKK